MLSKLTYFGLHWIFTAAITLRIVPYNWNANSRIVSVSKSKFWTIFLFKVVVCLQVSHTIFLLVRWFQSIFVFDFGAEKIVLQLFFVGSSGLTSCCILNTVYHAQEYAEFITQTIYFY